ncbi:hypothetical protein ACU686_20745 [Yinghuangia aomiensis]
MDKQAVFYAEDTDYQITVRPDDSADAVTVEVWEDARDVIPLRLSSDDARSLGSRLIHQANAVKARNSHAP